MWSLIRVCYPSSMCLSLDLTNQYAFLFVNSSHCPCLQSHQALDQPRSIIGSYNLTINLLEYMSIHLAQFAQLLMHALSQGSFYCSSLTDCFCSENSERVVSYLPLSHIAAQMLDIHMPIAICCHESYKGNATVTFARPDDLKASDAIT